MQTHTDTEIENLKQDLDARDALIAGAELARLREREREANMRWAKAEARLRAVTEAAEHIRDNGTSMTKEAIVHAASATLTAARSADLPPHPDTLQLRCLLARIHRDGGHYTEENGVAESCAEADRKVVEMLAALDAARAQAGKEAPHA